MKAVRRFDPEVGVRLVSFAVHWIKAEIHEFILKNWRIVKVATTKAQRKLFFNLRKAKKRLGWFTPEEVSAVAHDLNVSEKEVLRMEARLNAVDVGYDMPVADENDSSVLSFAPIHYLEDHSADPAQALESHNTEQTDRSQLYRALENLDERSRDILAQRWLAEKKATLHDLADQYNVSPERIRQLEANAMGKLREAMASDEEV